ncbi:MAG: peptidylprolyl isomerase [Bdellovibrionaceae bacterium]|jgi:FKBP-type peptidyl-prolyl cis-trans isomerase SlyD|nr:peptidylprolyl isomerase [Pseudobdellovibrionaceae bacterium]
MLKENTTPRVLSFHFTLKNDRGDVLDSTQGDEPLSFLTESGQILSALENALKTMMIGQKKTISLTAEEAYGVHDPKLVIQVDPKDLAHLEIEEGMFLQLNTGSGVQIVQVTAIGNDKVTLDGNHPLAGQNLVFDVELMDSRAATPEEIAHGHAHGPGGHHH